MSEGIDTRKKRGWASICRDILANRRVRLACYLVIMGVYAAESLYPDLGDDALRRGDEGHFADIIDQMHAGGDWIYPQHTDGRPYLNKPPLYMWLSVLTYDLFGEGPSRYRFWSATFGVGCILVTVLLGGRMFGPEVGGLAGWLLKKNDLFIESHGALSGTFDTGVTFFAALCFLFYWTIARRRDRWAGWLLVGLSAAGISLLKPFFGIPFLGVVSLHYLLTGNRWIEFRRLWGPVLATFVSLAAVAPWYAMQWQRYGHHYTAAIFWRNYIERAEGTLNAVYIRPVWYYLETMSESSFLLFVPALVWCMVLAWRGRKRAALRFCLFATVATVAAFSLAEQKLHHYVYPIYPLAAVMIAVGPVWLGRAAGRRFGRDIRGRSRQSEPDDRPRFLPSATRKAA